MRRERELGQDALIVWTAGDDGAFTGHTGYVRCVAQLNDRRIASGSRDKTLKV